MKWVLYKLSKHHSGKGQSQKIILVRLNETVVGFQLASSERPPDSNNNASALWKEEPVHWGCSSQLLSAPCTAWFIKCVWVQTSARSDGGVINSSPGLICLGWHMNRSSPLHTPTGPHLQLLMCSISNHISYRSGRKCRWGQRLTCWSVWTGCSSDELH